MIKTVDPSQAREILTNDPAAVLIDVRSKVEFDYVGHPLGAVHVAWKEFPDWSVNTAFADQVATALAARGGVAKDPILLMICRSGQRSLAAAEVLERLGYTNLHNIAEGFEGDKDAHNHRNTINGWRARGLPWEQT